MSHSNEGKSTHTHPATISIRAAQECSRAGQTSRTHTARSPSSDGARWHHPPLFTKSLLSLWVCICVCVLVTSCRLVSSEKRLLAKTRCTTVGKRALLVSAALLVELTTRCMCVFVVWVCLCMSVWAYNRDAVVPAAKSACTRMFVCGCTREEAEGC